MKKTRKFLSLFAILLMVIFAVGCVFMTACGNKDDDDEKETTHTHTYDGGVVTKEATCGEDGEMTYTCVDGDDSYTEVIPATGEHTWDDGEVTTEATCVDGETTYTCTVCGKTKTEAIAATEAHTFTREGSRVSFTWTEDSEKGYIVTATITCAVCETAIDVPENSITVTGPQEGMYGEYTASVTYEDVTAEETKKLEEPQLPYDPEKSVYQWSVDYSDATTYGWMTEGLTPENNSEGGQMYTLATSTSYSNGIVTYTTHSSGSTTINKENVGALFTAGTSSNFKIDLSGYEGDYVEITVRMSSNGSDSETATDGRILAVNTSVSTNNPLDSVTSNYKTDYQTLNYGQEITQEGTQLYLAWSENVRIFSMDINIYGDVTPEATTTITLDQTTLNLTLTNGTATGTVTATIVDASGEPYTGDLPTVESSNETNVEVSIEKSGEEGAYTITVTVKAEVTDVTITVAADDVTENITLSAKNASVTMTVNKSYMSLSGVGDTDSSIVTLTDEWGDAYGKGDVQITPTSENDNVATATYENGKIVVTAIGNGSATITVTGTWGQSSIGSFTISVTVAVSDFTEEDETYTMTATANATTSTYDVVATETGENLPVSVTVNGANNYKSPDSSKSTSDQSVTLKDYAEAGTSKGLTVTVQEGVTADIVVYASHSTSSAARTIFIGEGSSISGATKLAGETIDGAAGETGGLLTVTVTGLGGGTYQIYADATVHVYEVAVTYKYNAVEQGEKETKELNEAIDLASAETYSGVEGVADNYWYGVTETDQTGKTATVIYETGASFIDGVVTIYGAKETSTKTDGTLSNPMYYDSSSKYLVTNGASTSDGYYVKLDFSNYVEQVVTLNVVVSNTGDNESRSLLLSKTIQTSITNENTLAYVSSTSKSNGKVTLTYTWTVSDEELYLTWTKSIDLYSIAVTIGSDLVKGPSVTSVTTKTVENATIKVGDESSKTVELEVDAVTMSDGSTYANGYTWEIVEGGDYVSIKAGSNGTKTTVTAVAAGTAKIKVTVWYDGGSCSSAEITITVEAADES